MGERWVSTTGYEGYEISDQGRVRSYKTGGTGVTALPRDMHPHAPVNGYARVALPRRGGGRGYTICYIHRLVFEAFVGPPPDDLEVAHFNGDKTDNRLANLGLTTHEENCYHKRFHGTHRNGERIGNAKLTQEKVTAIRRLMREAKDIIAARFDITPSCVNIVVGRTCGNCGRKRLNWSHLPEEQEQATSNGEAA